METISAVERKRSPRLRDAKRRNDCGKRKRLACLHHGCEIRINGNGTPGMAITMGARQNKLCVLRFGNFTSFCNYLSSVREKEGIIFRYCNVISSSERNLRRVVVFCVN